MAVFINKSLHGEFSYFGGGLNSKRDMKKNKEQAKQTDQGMPP